MATVKKGLPWLLILVAVLVAVALVGAVLLLCLGRPVPGELWTLVSGGFTFFLGGAAWSFKPATPPAS
jgi:hypothetical protein